MKLAFALLAAAALSSITGCSSSAHPRKDARSRSTCEQLLRHSFQLQTNLATLALDDHGYQRRKLEAELRRQEEEIKNSPTFLESCNKLTAAEYDCMTRAPDWYTYTSCYAPEAGSATAEAQDVPTDADASSSPEPSPDDVTAEAAPPPPPRCPAVTNLGSGLATITGKVRGDDPRATPQADLGVVLTAGGPESHGEAITDAQGRFTFSQVKPGIYEVSAMLGPTDGITRCVVVRGGSTTPVEVVVHIPPEEPSEVIILDPGKPAKKPR